MRDNTAGNGYSLAYTYDHNGNRASKTMGGSTTTYTYDAHDKLTAAGSKTYGYDSNGNCTSVTAGTSVTSLTYDVENRVKSITYPGSTTNTFAYNGEDLRVQKVDSSGTANYVTDGSSPASAVLKDGSAVYTPGLSERRGTASKFYHADALGSTRGITDSGQAVTDSLRYDAFGNVASHTGTTPTPFGFVGKAQYQTDGDSGLQLLGHRYYDPSIGRFLSSDPVKAGTNWYVYCDNNPLGNIDPLGLDPKKAKLKEVIKTELLMLGGLIGGTIGTGPGNVGQVMINTGEQIPSIEIKDPRQEKNKGGAGGKPPDPKPIHIPTPIPAIPPSPGLIKRVGDFMRGIGPILRGIGTIGEQLGGAVASPLPIFILPDMFDPEHKKGVPSA